MSTVALVFGWLLAAIGLLLVAVLATPLSITLRASVEDRLRWSLRMSLFGGIGPGLSVSDDTFAKDSTPGPSRPAQKAGRSRIEDPFRLLRPVGRLLGDIVGAFRLRMASLDVRFGAGDPAETGHIYGLLSPLIHGMPDWPRTEIRIVPDFERAILSARAEVELAVIPARLLPPVVRFGWSAWRTAR